MINQLEFWAILFGAAAIYWLLPRGRNEFLALGSFAYLASLDPLSVGTLLVFALLVFFGSRRTVGTGRRARWILVGLIALVGAHLAWFKYVPPLLAAFATHELDRRLLLPLGVSFYTFKLIHYVIEVSRGNVRSRDFALFATWVFLFPIFTAGPIERYDHFVRERETRPHVQMFVDGLTRIVSGLVKKFAIADLLLVSLLSEPPTREIVTFLAVTPPEQVWWHVFLLFLYSYLDFSAYTDIAIGASRLFGFPIMENFRFPILATNISEFWNRWHMTLTGWCRAYVYLPLIGLTRNPYVATFGAFTVIGLWHEGSLNYLAWGLYHATGISGFQFGRRLWRARGLPRARGRVARLLGWAATMAYVSGSYVFTATAGEGGIVAGFRMLARLLWIDVGS